MRQLIVYRCVDEADVEAATNKPFTFAYAFLCIAVVLNLNTIHGSRLGKESKEVSVIDRINKGCTAAE